MDEERRGVPNFFFQRAGALAAAEVQRQRGGDGRRELSKERSPPGSQGRSRPFSVFTWAQPCVSHAHEAILRGFGIM